jgi:TRAP-type uncharacterized transport system fused permease subunit
MTLPKGYGNRNPPPDEDGDTKIPSLRVWHPLYFIPIGLGMLVFIMVALSLPFSQLVYIGFSLCLISFFFVFLASKLGSKASTLPNTPAERLTQDVDKLEEEWDPDESPAVMLGANGVYGIVYGLGITDALGEYARWLSAIGTRLSLSIPLDWLGILVTSLPNTYRLLGFLVTIIPFIHGAVLMFSYKWYYDKKRMNIISVQHLFTSYLHSFMRFYSFL